MADDEYKTLPLDQLLDHKLWKARQFAYTQLQELADSNINNDLIVDLSNNIDKIKKIVGDTNVISQESGIQTFSTILKRLGPNFCIQTRETIVPIIVEKGLTSSRANAKNYATETLLLYAELDSPEQIVELMIPSLNAKSPKQITATIKGINEIFKEFGCNIVSPKLIMDEIPKLFAHSDKNVRADATVLSVTIRSYIGDSFDKIIFPNLKPIQQKDLTKLFDKIEGDIKPNRLTLTEQKKSKSVMNDNDDDVEMSDINIQVTTEQKEFDPYEFEVPVEVLSKLPNDLSTRLSDPIWRERVQVLEEIGKFFKVIKIQNDDFHYFISLMVGCLKDVNLQVVTLSCEMIIDLANGLKSNFSKYTHTLINPLLERTKEKKKNVLDSLNNLLDLCFKYGSFNEILDPIVEHMAHISPPVKVEAMKYLVRCLKEIDFVPNSIQVEQIMNAAIKLLSDSQLPVRNSASDIIGTLMKLTGPEQSKQYLDKIDKRHLKKVQEVCDNAIVKILTKSENIPIKNVNHTTGTSRTSNNRPLMSGNKVPELKSVGPSRSFNTNENKRTPLAENRGFSLTSSSTSSSSIPSKRTAASPLKENTPNQKNALTSRSLKVSNVNTYGLSAQQLQELELLKAEKAEWLENRKQLINELDNAKNKNDELIKNVVTLNGKLDDFHNKLTTMNMTLKSKDTQILRYRSDLELSQNKNMQLQQKIKVLETQPELVIGDTNNKSPTEESSEINRRISILSIDSNLGETHRETPALDILGSSMYNFDDNDDGWKRATAITNDLKAKIQQMKSRSRLLDLEDD